MVDIRPAQTSVCLWSVCCCVLRLQCEMQGDVTSQRRWEAYDKLGTFAIYVIGTILVIQVRVRPELWLGTAHVSCVCVACGSWQRGSVMALSEAITS